MPSVSLPLSAHYPQYRAPSQSNSALVVPPAADLIALLKKPAEFLQTDSSARLSPLEFCGLSYAKLRARARAEVVLLASEYTQAYRDVTWLNRQTVADSNVDATMENLPAIVMAGHQPELFHPGVWFKNFLLDHVAGQSGAIAINFIVDNDLCRTTSIKVPTRNESNSFAINSIPFDTARSAIPWEMRRLESKDCWNSFPQRAHQSLPQTMPEPILDELWTFATSRLAETNRIGLALSQARHLVEERVGLRTLELPLSTIARTRSFASFSIQLLSELPRFQDVYNSQLLHYRKVHGIRNHAHPVPALEQTDGWLEAPWWVYRNEAPERQHLWVRLLNDQLILSDRAGWQASIDGRLDCENASRQWMEFSEDGVHLRPRALLTTMYSRMVLSDLFIHGIGGGKYDQLTDAIIGEYFGIQAPPMSVATATMHHPIAESWHSGSSEQLESEIESLHQRLWQAKHQPESLLTQNASAIATEVDGLIQQKQGLLADIPERGEKWEWHRQLKSVNRQLTQFVEPIQRQLKTDLDAAVAKQKELRLIQSREFSYCLFPLEPLSRQLAELTS